VDRDRAGLSLRTLSSERERTQAIATFAEMLQTPAFPDAAFAREKARLVDSVKEDETKPDAIASKAFYRLLYAAHPYALAPTPETALRIERADVERFYRANYVAERAVVTIIATPTARSPSASPSKSLLRCRAPPARRSRSAGDPAGRTDAAHRAPGVAEPYPARGAGDRAQRRGLFPPAGGNYVLGGGGFVSRLYLEVREKRGYAYSVYSYFLPLAQEGPFQIGCRQRKSKPRKRWRGCARCWTSTSSAGRARPRSRRQSRTWSAGLRCA